MFYHSHHYRSNLFGSNPKQLDADELKTDVDLSTPNSRSTRDIQDPLITAVNLKFEAPADYIDANLAIDGD